MTAMQPRNRFVYATVVGLTIVLGLASRKFAFLLPFLLAKNAGDVLYAVMVFWLVGFLLPRISTVRAALIAGLFCFSIEFLKFSDVPWLVAARHSHAGALVFGVGFHWFNLVCYAIGAGIAAALEKAFREKPPSPQ